MTSAMAIEANDLVPVGGAPSIGNVAEFDEPRGLGIIEYGPGRRLPFHCTAITDGSRQINPGTVVAFNVGAGRLGRLEARSVRPLPGVVPPGSSLAHTQEDRSQAESVPSDGPAADDGQVGARAEPAVVEPEPAVVGLAWLAAPEAMAPMPGLEPERTAAEPRVAPEVTTAGPPSVDGGEPEILQPVDDTRLDETGESDVGFDDTGEGDAGPDDTGEADVAQGELAVPPEDPVEPVRAVEPEPTPDLASHGAPFDFESDGLAPRIHSEESAGPVSGGVASGTEFEGGVAVVAAPPLASSEGDGWGSSSPAVDSTVDSTPPMGTPSVAPGVTVAPPVRSPEASSWLDQPEPAPSGRSGDDESPRPDFWTPIAKSSSGPPPTWRTPVTRRSPAPSDGD